MNSLFQKLQYKFNYATIVERIIYITIAVFIFTFVIEAIASLIQVEGNPIFDWFSLPTSFQDFIVKPWTIVTYGFLHGGFWHILFNLLILYYFGNLFLDFFSKRDFLIYYFAGIIAGGIVYILSYNYFPALKNTSTTLVGASAGVTAIVIGIATKIPNYAMHFRFIGAVKLWYIAVGLIVLDIIQIPISNTGGHLSHLGGAITGWLLTTYFSSGKKSSKNSVFSSFFKSKKQGPLKTVYKKQQSVTGNKIDEVQQQKIDKILDKISKSGYDALTKEEKDFLFSVGKK